MSDPDPLVANLQRALLLRFSPAHRGQGPDTAAAAERIGISRRQLERWLSGKARPRPESLLALSRALMPPMDDLERELDEARYAAQAAKAMARARGRGITKQWRAQGWHHEHLVMVLSQPALGVHRIAVIRNEQRPRNDAVRVKPRWTAPGGVWGTEDLLVVPHRFAGVQVRAQVLEDVRQWRVWVRPEVMPVAGTQTWLDSAPEVNLGPIAVTLGYR